MDLSLSCPLVFPITPYLIQSPFTPYDKSTRISTMQLLKSFAAAATLLTLSANAATVGKRQTQTCDEGLKNIGVGSDGVHSQACENLVRSLLNQFLPEADASLCASARLARA